MASMKSIILIHFAYLNSYSGGVNLKKSDDKLSLYLKNCCVSCVSAKANAGCDTDVALVTNLDIPKIFRNILEKAEVKVLMVDFDYFNFNGTYDWSLAFYKLNALYHAVNELKYDNYAYLDSDVYVQGSFSDIWKECSKKIMMYDICHGLQVEDYQRFLEETTKFLGSETLGLTHYGGEFFAANRENAKLFVDECLTIYDEMMDRQFKTSMGDEFISSLAANRLSGSVRNAGAYVFRFWTRRFHLMSTSYQYNPAVVLHVPQEKDFGMLKIFEKYIVKGKLPIRKKMWQLLHLSSTDWKISLYLKLKALKG